MRKALIATAAIAVLASCGPAASPPAAPVPAAPAGQPAVAAPGETAIPAAVKAKHEGMLNALKYNGLPALAAIVIGDGAKFSFGDEKLPLPVWQAMEGNGRDVRAELTKALSMRGGQYEEGGRVFYAYPYLAALAPDQITGAAMDDFKALAPAGFDPATDPTVKEVGYMGWRAILTADGKLEALVIGD